MPRIQTLSSPRSSVHASRPTLVMTFFVSNATIFTDGPTAKPRRPSTSARESTVTVRWMATSNVVPAWFFTCTVRPRTRLFSLPGGEDASHAPSLKACGVCQDANVKGAPGAK